MTPTTPSPKKRDDPSHIPTTPKLNPTSVVSKTVTLTPSSSAAVSAAKMRLEEKKQELQALRAILLKKHKTITPAFVHEDEGESPPKKTTTTHGKALVGNEYTIAKNASVEVDGIVDNNNNKNTRNVLPNQTPRKKRRPLSMAQVKHKQRLLRMRYRHAGKGYKKNTLWHGLQMIASEIVFACTPMVGGIDDKQDGDDDDDRPIMLCSTMEKTAHRMTCLGKDTKETVGEDEEDANSIITKPKDINVDFMPKFKASTSTHPLETEPQDDDTVSYTAVTTNTTTLGGATTTTESVTSESLIKLLLEHQRQRKKIREALDGRSSVVVPDQESNVMGSNSIGTRLTTTNGSMNSNENGDEHSIPQKSIVVQTKKYNKLRPMIGEGKQNDPIVLLSSNEEENEKLVNHPNNSKKYQGNATADAPLLLLSESIENLFRQGKDHHEKNKKKTTSNNNNNPSNKKPSIEASQRIIRLLSKDSTMAVKMSLKGDALSFTATSSADSPVETMTDSNEEDDTVDGTITNNGTEDNDDVSSSGDYRDIDEKVMMQIRLAQLKKKHQQQRRRLGKQLPPKAMENGTTTTNSAAAASTNTSTLAATTPPNGATTSAAAAGVVVVGEERNNHSNHSHMTRDTTKRNNTTSKIMTMVKDDQREDTVSSSEEDYDDDHVREDVEEDVIVDENKVQEQEQRPVDIKQHGHDKGNNAKDDGHPQSPDIFEHPLDAEELYRSSLRMERRLKDLEEMKKILGNSNRHRITGVDSPSFYVRNHYRDGDDVLSYANVYDMQRASNFSVLQALRQRHLDVVRMQLQE